jgi:hypothetical protein
VQHEFIILIKSIYYTSITEITLSRKKRQWIDRSAVLAYFEIQDRRPVSALAHVRDHLTDGNVLAIVHQHLAIVGVRGQQAVGVFDDD